MFGSAGFQSRYAAQPALTLMVCTTLEYHVLVTLSLWILSAIFHHLFPLAFASLVASLGVCVLAASQATIAKSKVRPWSRPLVALLFFLQPIVRGWARYRGRLLPRPAPLAARQTLESVALRESGRSLGEVDYWSATRLDRLLFVTTILARLDQHGWPAKSETGWSDYDVEIYGSRWNHLQLATVAEEHSQGRSLVRCRLRVRWSLQAKVLIWVLGGFELLLLGFLGRRWPWLWLLLVSVPLFAWFLHRQGRSLQSAIVVFLDQLAQELHLAKLEPNLASRPPASQTLDSTPNTPHATAADESVPPPPRPEPLL